MTAILGLSAYFHDSAACLVVDGEIVAAAQEERFSRVKHDARFPSGAAAWCLRSAGLRPGQLDLVGFYDKPLVKFERLLETSLDYAPAGFPAFVQAMPLWMKEKLWLPDGIRVGIARACGEASRPEREVRAEARSFPWKVLFGSHHESHAASAFYPSPFEEAAILTMDGVGEWATSSVGFGKGNAITLLKELRFPDSLGLLYSAFTAYSGFRVNGGEYKVMGLAPYGEPAYAGLIREKLVHVSDDGSIRLNQEYFTFAAGLKMTGTAFERLIGGPPRKPEAKLTQRDADLARSIQEVTEEVMLKMARFANRETGLRKLCLAGGVALNCVGNGRILREGPFTDLWIQPAAGDAGGAVGIALALWHRYLGKERISPEAAGAWEPGRPDGGLPRYADGMKGACLGPAHGEEEIEAFLRARNLPYRKLPRERLAGEVASLLADGKVVGLHQGRMEFGPRALGSRSILGDPRSPSMQAVMNLKIKLREGFRPFAPSVQRERLGEWFEMDAESPYMLLAAQVAKGRRREPTPEENARRGLDRLGVARSEVPAVTHVDSSARIQTVRRETSPVYWEILEAFRLATGCPVVVNTSFNVRGEPIVCTPEDSWRCFMRTEMDALVLETCLLHKEGQPEYVETRTRESAFPLD